MILKIFRVLPLIFALGWLFIAYSFQGILVGNYVSSFLVDGFRITAIFLLLGTPSILYFAYLIHRYLLRSSTPILITILSSFIIVGLLRFTLTVYENNKLGGNPIGMVSTESKIYILDKGSLIIKGGWDPTDFTYANPVIWVVDNQKNKLVKKLKIVDRDFNDHNTVNRAKTPQIVSFRNKVYYPYEQKILVVDAESDSVDIFDLNQMISTPLRKELRVRDVDVGERDGSLYLLLFTPGTSLKSRTDIILKIDLDSLKVVGEFDLKNDFVVHGGDFPKAIFVGNDGPIRFLTVVRFHQDSGGLVKFGDSVTFPSPPHEYVVTAVDPSNGSIIEEYKTDVQKGEGRLSFDKISNTVYLPSPNNHYVSFDFTNKSVDTASFKTQKSKNNSWEMFVAIGETVIYHVRAGIVKADVTVIDRENTTKSSDFGIRRRIFEDSTFGVTNDLLYIVDGNNLLVYNQNGKLVSKTSLR